jgi:hypothetical protein
MQKKSAPIHIQNSVFIHPKANSSFITVLEKVPDPRGASPNFSYSLTSMLSGAEEWEEMAIMGEQMFCKRNTEDVIAIDGKSLCGSLNQANDKRAVHL